MVNNSILSNLSKEDIISEITLGLNSDFQNKISYIVVEGPDDVKFFSAFVSKDTYIVESYSGKMGLESIIKQFEDNRVIGIRDKDYQLEKQSQYIFYYDFSCLEMMLIKNDEVFEKLINEYYVGSQSFTEIRDFILKQLKPISILRRYNERKLWGINFERVKLNKFLVGNDNHIDYERYFDEISKLNRPEYNKSLIDADSQLNWNVNDFYNNTQGHDFLIYLSRICSISNKGVSDSSLASSARVAFRKSDYKLTSLYGEIKRFESSHNRKILSL